jgi:hypothetical protein
LSRLVSQPTRKCVNQSATNVRHGKTSCNSCLTTMKPEQISHSKARTTGRPFDFEKEVERCCRSTRRRNSSLSKQCSVSRRQTLLPICIHAGKSEGLLRERANFPKGAGASKFDPNGILPMSSGCSVSRHNHNFDSARSTMEYESLPSS